MKDDTLPAKEACKHQTTTRDHKARLRCAECGAKLVRRPLVNGAPLGQVTYRSGRPRPGKAAKKAAKKAARTTPGPDEG